MSTNRDRVLTTVRIDPQLFEDFKVECVRRKFTFQKLAERTIHLYLNDEEFRKQVHNHNILMQSKSELTIYDIAA